MFIYSNATPFLTWNQELVLRAVCCDFDVEPMTLLTLRKLPVLPALPILTMLPIPVTAIWKAVQMGMELDIAILSPLPSNCKILKPTSPHEYYVSVDCISCPVQCARWRNLSARARIPKIFKCLVFVRSRWQTDFKSNARSFWYSWADISEQNQAFFWLICVRAIAQLFYFRVISIGFVVIITSAPVNNISPVFWIFLQGSK